jgi:Alginate export
VLPHNRSRFFPRAIRKPARKYERLSASLSLRRNSILSPLESIDLGIEFHAHTTTAKRWPVSRWPPRIELQLDVASGTDNPNGDTLGTFNPLFPSGFYEMLAGYPSYAHFVRLRSSAHRRPRQRLLGRLRPDPI